MTEFDLLRAISEVDDSYFPQESLPNESETDETAPLLATNEPAVVRPHKNRIWMRVLIANAACIALFVSVWALYRKTHTDIPIVTPPQTTASMTTITTAQTLISQTTPPQSDTATTASLSAPTVHSTSAVTQTVSVTTALSADNTTQAPPTATTTPQNSSQGTVKTTTHTAPKTVTTTPQTVKTTSKPVTTSAKPVTTTADVHTTQNLEVSSEYRDTTVTSATDKVGDDSSTSGGNCVTTTDKEGPSGGPGEQNPTNSDPEYKTVWYDDVEYHVYENHASIVGHEFTGNKLELPSTLNGVPVTQIETAAFADMPANEVILPSSLKRIDDRAFAYSQIRSIVVPESVKYMGSAVFKGCMQLQSAEIHAEISYLASEMFEWCSSLSAVTLPQTLYSIEAYAFYECSSLTDLELPESVEWIDDTAFLSTPFENTFR